MEVRSGSAQVILDAGTGIRELGRQVKLGPKRDIHVLLTHYHWDQVQGLPFFEPLYMRGRRIHISGPKPQAKTPVTMKGVLDAMFRAPFFPVSADQLQATIKLRELNGRDDFHIGKLRVRTCLAHHPQGALIFRLDDRDGSVMYATDHEPGMEKFDRPMVKLAEGVNVLICDAQYRPGELRGTKAGWGHGSWRAAALLAKMAGVRALILFHHEPWRSDHELDQFLHLARSTFSDTFVASEGLRLHVKAGRVEMKSLSQRLGVRAAMDVPVQVEVRSNGSHRRSRARLTDLSFYGAYLVSPSPYQAEESLEVAFPWKSRGGRRGPLRLRGNVLRSDLRPWDGEIGVAVEFPS